MKNKVKKILSLALVFIFALSLPLASFAADITTQKAKSIALTDAGFDEKEVSYLSVKSGYDDGVKIFDVSFISFNGDGSYTEYDYEIKASNGKVLERDIDTERGKSQLNVASKGNDIGIEQAKRIALGYFGEKAEDVKFLQMKKDYDDGRGVYEIEFCRPYSIKYSCEVSESNGLVKDADRETVRGIFDKIELFIEVLIWSILGR